MQIVGQIGGHILHGMDGQINPAVQQGVFNFLDKEPFAAHLGQRHVQDLVALGGNSDQFNRRSRMLFLNLIFDPG